MKVEARTVEHEVYETGVNVDNRPVTTYEIGVVVDGVFVPFTSKAGHLVDDAVAKGKAADEADAAKPAAA